MLSSNEMVMDASGKMKTLADMIKDSSMITPETPVHISNDMVVLEDYIKSVVASLAQNNGGENE